MVGQILTLQKEEKKFPVGCCHPGHDYQNPETWAWEIGTTVRICLERSKVELDVYIFLREEGGDWVG